MLFWLHLLIYCISSDKAPLDPIEFPNATIQDNAPQGVFNLTQVLEQYSNLNITNSSISTTNDTNSHLSKRSYYYSDTFSTTISSSYAYYLDYSPVYMSSLYYSASFSNPTITLFILKIDLNSCLTYYGSCSYYTARSCVSPSYSCSRSVTGLSPSSSYVLLFINPNSYSSSYLSGSYNLYYTTGSPYPYTNYQAYGNGYISPSYSVSTDFNSLPVVIGCSVAGVFILIIVFAVVCKSFRGRSDRIEPDMPHYIPPMQTMPSQQAVPIYPPPIGDYPANSPVYYVPVQLAQDQRGSFQVAGPGRVSPVP